MQILCVVEGISRIFNLYFSLGYLGPYQDNEHVNCYVISMPFCMGENEPLDFTGQSGTRVEAGDQWYSWVGRVTRPDFTRSDP